MIEIEEHIQDAWEKYVEKECPNYDLER